VRFAGFNDLASAERAVSDRTAAVIIEPVQGEGGVVPARTEFLAGLRALCDRHRALLIFDEVQCGLGRIGSLHAYQSFGVVPDMMTLAKPLAAGIPLGATLVAEKVATLLEPGQHGSTFSGGPAACALGVRVFDAINRPELMDQAGRPSARGARRVGGGVHRAVGRARDGVDAGPRGGAPVAPRDPRRHRRGTRPGAARDARGERRREAAPPADLHAGGGGRSDRDPRRDARGSRRTETDEGKPMTQRVRKVVLAYSGGLDTSIIIDWLLENYGCEVMA
jgi:hypothetical protein